jgi:hypothetical protein
MLVGVLQLHKSASSDDLEYERDLNIRVARSRQTVAFASRQREHFATLNITRCTIWEAVKFLDEIPRCARLPESSRPLRRCY